LTLAVPAGELRGPARVQEPQPFALLDLRLLLNRDHVDRGVRRRLLSHSSGKDFLGLLPPSRIGKCRAEIKHTKIWRSPILLTLSLLKKSF
jgi:hypothetical protein